jgi:outer membrane lipoprotein-sorting protein
MLKNRNKVIIGGFVSLLLLVVITGQAIAQDGYSPVQDTALFAEKLKKASGITGSISSDFLQLKHLGFLEEDVESSGRFYFRREKQLRWEYTAPFFYLIIFSGDSIMIRDDERTLTYDAASSVMFREINDVMLNMVSGNILGSGHYKWSAFENDQNYMIELRPLKPGMKEFLEKIRLFLNKTDFSVDELLMIEASGDFTHIKFVNKQLNEAIPDHIFHLD